MEDRIAARDSERPGAALIALAAIMTITAAWWALAFWPTGGAEPEWLARTRAACFGAALGGLPDAGGLVLLIGEPAGMVGVLFAVWGRSLRRQLAWIGSSRPWRIAAITVAAPVLLAGASMAIRVAGATGVWVTAPAAPPGSAVRVNRDPPDVTLVDQFGRRTSLADFHGRTVLVTFAFGHCSTVCPAVVNQLRVARRSANRPGAVIVVITLDPWRDTPDRLTTIANRWGLASPDRVLSATVPEVESALDAFGVGRRRDGVTGDIAHSATVLLLNEHGRIAWRVEGGWMAVAELLRTVP